MSLLETAKQLNITPAGLRHAIATGRTTNAAVAREFGLTLSTGTKRPPATDSQRSWNSRGLK